MSAVIVSALENEIQISLQSSGYFLLRCDETYLSFTPDCKMLHPLAEMCLHFPLIATADLKNLVPSGDGIRVA